MVERQQLVIETDCIPTGCTLLNLCLSGRADGGWACNRISNIVGDKSCLTGDTIISVQRGVGNQKQLDLSTVFQRVKGNHFNQDSTLDTYILASLGETVGMIRLLDIYQSGTKAVYRITDEEGHYIDASAEHVFKTSEGWANVSDLRVGTPVETWIAVRHRGWHGRKPENRVTIHSIPFHPFAQRHFIAGRNYKRIPRSRLTIEAGMNGLSLQELIQILRHDPQTAATLHYTDPNLHVHHLNGNSNDDSLDNLRLLAPTEHYNEHADKRSFDMRRISLTRIKFIEEIGDRPTFDLKTEGPYNNFIANNFVVHNSGKTGLAIEACANFAKLHSVDNIRYIEAESAFDDEYARIIGLPPGMQTTGGVVTVEELWKDLMAHLDHCKGQPSLYIVDSLDALSDVAELERDLGDATYGTSKARKLSELFRRCVTPVAQAKCTMLIVSQVRDNIGVTFGARDKRSGGRALDFYASAALWLDEKKKITRTFRAVDRVIGIEVIAKTRKNKTAPPFRDAEFTLMFNYGIDDETSMINWLHKYKALNVPPEDMKKQLRKAREDQDWDRLRDMHQGLVQPTVALWDAIELELAPPIAKYSQ